jgi:hypothetical protein
MEERARSMSENKPLVIGLIVAVVLLLGAMVWKYMVPHAPPVGSHEPYIPGAANYGAPAGQPR